MAQLRYFIPNAFTGLSLLLGLASISRSVDGDFSLAAWMVLWGVLLDKLDGTAARLLKASSGFGAQFDSFADFVAFGIAPAFLVYYQLRALGYATGGWHVFMLVAVAVYVLATAARLARFNISEPPGGKYVFYGIPTTMMGALIGSGFLTWHKYQLDPTLLRALPVILLVGAVLMVSRVRLPKLKPRGSLAINIIQFGNVACAYVFGPLMLFPEYLFTLAMIYLVVGIGWYVVFPPTFLAEDEPSLA